MQIIIDDKEIDEKSVVFIVNNHRVSYVERYNAWLVERFEYMDDDTPMYSTYDTYAFSDKAISVARNLRSS